MYIKATKDGLILDRDHDESGEKEKDAEEVVQTQRQERRALWNEIATRYKKREFHVGSGCSMRLLLYHGLFHWKHRLMARLKLELKKELQKDKEKSATTPTHPPATRDTLVDGVLQNEEVMDDLWGNFKTFISMGEEYQLAGGEGAWGKRNKNVDGHRMLTQVLAWLHYSSDGEESDIDFEKEIDQVQEGEGVGEEEEEEPEHGEGEN